MGPTPLKSPTLIQLIFSFPAKVLSFISKYPVLVLSVPFPFPCSHKLYYSVIKSLFLFTFVLFVLTQLGKHWSPLSSGKNTNHIVALPFGSHAFALHTKSKRGASAYSHVDIGSSKPTQLPRLLSFHLRLCGEKEGKKQTHKKIDQCGSGFITAQPGGRAMTQSHTTKARRCDGMQEWCGNARERDKSKLTWVVWGKTL